MGSGQGRQDHSQHAAPAVDHADADSDAAFDAPDGDAFEDFDFNLWFIVQDGRLEHVQDRHGRLQFPPNRRSQ